MLRKDFCVIFVPSTRKIFELISGNMVVEVRFLCTYIGAAFMNIFTYFIHLYHGTEELLNLYCALILIAIVIIMSFLSFWQERKALQVGDDEEKLSQLFGERKSVFVCVVCV